jgi:hypothetical protein
MHVCIGSVNAFTRLALVRPAISFSVLQFGGNLSTASLQALHTRRKHLHRFTGFTWHQLSPCWYTSSTVGACVQAGRLIGLALRRDCVGM